MNSYPSQGDGLRRLRLACQLSQEQVASCLNISRTTYGAYERGERLIPEDMLSRCSRLYRIRPDSPSVFPERDFSFTGEEQELLLDFRQLDASGRKRILSLIRLELDLRH